MKKEHEFTSKTVNCPAGHQLKLEMLSGTPNMIKKVECPTCAVSMIVFAGDIRGVVPLGVEADSSSSAT
jgi:hypothetical protein